MEQIGKIEIIFAGRSLEDQLNTMETSLLRGGAYDPDPNCIEGGGCVNGTGGCKNGGPKSTCQPGSSLA